MTTITDKTHYQAAAISAMTVCMTAYNMFFSKHRKQLLKRLQSRKKLHQASGHHDDDEMLLLLHMISTQTLYRHRRFWVDARSGHWVHHVSRGNILRDAAFEKTFRLTRKSFNKLLSILEPYIHKKDTHFRPAIPSATRLMAFCLYGMRGFDYQGVADQLGIGNSTACDCVHECVRAIRKTMYETYIRLPTIVEAQQNMENWRQQCGVPGIVGALDGTHIAIAKPLKDGQDYFNRKSFYSINVQALVDYRKRFLDLEIGYPGSVGDARIFELSYLNRAHIDYLSQLPTTSLVTDDDDAGNAIENQIPAFILADSAYRNTKHVVTTYKVTECDRDPDIADLNKKLGAARYHVENAFGILKGRFRAFKKALAGSAEDIYFTCEFIAAIFILHNFMIDERDEVQIEELDMVDDTPRRMINEGIGNHGGRDEQGTREVLLQWMRWRNGTI